MSFSIQSTALAVEAANLAPAPAVKSTSDTTSAAPGQKQASSHTVSPNAPQESKETQAQTTQEAAHGDASESAREGNFKQVFRPRSALTGLSSTRGRDTLDGVKELFTSHPALSAIGLR
jgi:hypothetical protein